MGFRAAALLAAVLSLPVPALRAEEPVPPPKPEEKKPADPKPEEKKDESGAKGKEGSGEVDAIAARMLKEQAAAVAVLGSFVTGQKMMIGMGKVDCDEDGIGEFGTIRELTGEAGLRKGFTAGDPAASDFSSKGTPMVPPYLTGRYLDYETDGVVRKGGYCYRIFLPDSAKQAGFVHETGTAESIGLAGGTGKIGVDLAETTWCAYAWPLAPGNSGELAYFVNQEGTVLQSSNTKAKWGGKRAPAGNSAFLGEGITSRVAVGTVGRDGDVWKAVK